MDNQEKFSAYVVIPAYILFDKELSDKAKLLYGLISSMCNHKGYCWATNAVFMRYLSVESTKTPQRLLRELRERGYIQVVDGQGGKADARQIYLTNFLPCTPDRNVQSTPDKNVPGTPDKNVLQNNININNTPYSPPKEGSKKLRRNSDGVVRLTEQQERTFAAFWTAWPKKTDKQKARERWFRLNPDEKLLEDILSAIARQKASPQWRDVQFIPGPAKWLLNRKWEDEAESPVRTENTEVNWLE